MKPSILICLSSFLFIGCSETYTPEQISDSYCECSQLTEDKKVACVKEWSIKYKGSLTTNEEHKRVNYKMIECNGFEGDNDFYLKLIEN